MNNKQIRYLVFLIITLLFVYIQGEEISYMLICILVLPGVYAIISFIYSKKFISIVRMSDRDRYVCGENGDFDFIIKNKGFFVIPFLEIYNSNITKLNSIYTGEIITLSPRQEVLISNNIHFNKRGTYTLDEFNYIAKDIFGMLSFKGKSSSELNIKVYPRIYNLSYETISGKDSFGNNGTSKIVEDNYIVKEMRRYKDGDPLKKINWKVSAKRRELYVKEDDKTSGKDIVVFLDMSKDNYKSYNDIVFEEVLVDFSISLIDTFVKSNTSCTVLVNNEEIKEFEIDNSFKFDNLIEYMVLNDSIGSLSLSELLYTSKERLKGFYGACIIINQLDYKNYESILNIVRRGLRINVFYISNSIENQKISKMKESGVMFYNIQACLDGGGL